jgi:hypothetical protein
MGQAVESCFCHFTMQLLPVLGADFLIPWNADNIAFTIH